MEIKSIIKDFKNRHNSFYKVFKIIGDNDSILDVGCGNTSVFRFIKKDGFKTGIDIYEKDLKDAEEQGLHDNYILGDVTKTDFPQKSYDWVIATELIEHLKKEDGERILKVFSKIARKGIILSTPNGFIDSPKFIRDMDNIHQKHLSGWEIEELQQKGYNVKGSGGFKMLVFLPASIRQYLSFITDFYLFNHPKFSSNLIAYKILK